MNDEICVKSQWIRGLTFPFSILLIFVILVFRTDTNFRILFHIDRDGGSYPCMWK